MTPTSRLSRVLASPHETDRPANLPLAACSESSWDLLQGLEVLELGTLPSHHLSPPHIAYVESSGRTTA